MNSNPFQILQIPEQFNVNMNSLKDAYLQHHRQQMTCKQVCSLKVSEEEKQKLNTAYLLLKNDIPRANICFDLLLNKLKQKKPQLNQKILSDQLQLGEQLDSIVQSDDNNKDKIQRLKELNVELDSKQKNLIQQFQEQFQLFQENGNDITTILAQLNFIQHQKDQLKQHILDNI